MHSVEICAGAGGQALGLELAGFEHTALVEIEPPACATLRLNRPEWNVIEGDLRQFSGIPYKGVDLLAGGVPCPPFSIAGKQLGANDERDLFPEAFRLVDEIRPKAVMLENVRGMLDKVFDDYRNNVIESLRKLGYTAEWKLIHASDFGVPQLRPRVIFVAVRSDLAHNFTWPKAFNKRPLTVGETLYDLMGANGWLLAERWKEWANSIAPTIVGGSKKHGGPDLGPTRAKRAWASLAVDGAGIANEAPEPNFIGFPRLTNRMVARIQGFPDYWEFTGKKTAEYRQIGNAFPPPVASAVGAEIKKCIEASIIANFKRIQGL
ncbi:DNA cytosine methyltransferase [Paenibacillus xylaniclasticus]|uniref:DNA cytosine methyltransferase n=1 Tax=Paenibacillus xylaniclasticus TaxID=588083 RepID=UPI0017725AAC|nr:MULTISPECIES: DNA cytosine methyltransferase [Paenibacillus]GFN30596.1 cytosine-specific methyltransferase [Paenibacillus curdlanolyticus]